MSMLQFCEHILSFNFMPSQEHYDIIPALWHHITPVTYSSTKENHINTYSGSFPKVSLRISQIFCVRTPTVWVCFTTKICRFTQIFGYRLWTITKIWECIRFLQLSICASRVTGFLYVRRRPVYLSKPYAPRAAKRKTRSLGDQHILTLSEFCPQIQRERQLRQMDLKKSKVFARTIWSTLSGMIQ